MKWFQCFGRPITLAEIIKRNQRALGRAIRELDKVKTQMEMGEMKIKIDIKKCIAEGELESARILAKNLIQNRQFSRRFIILKANMQAVSLKLQTLSTQHAISRAIREVILAMRQMNFALNLPQVGRILKEFEKQTILSETKSEEIQMSLEDFNDEEEADSLIREVLSEFGLVAEPCSELQIQNEKNLPIAEVISPIDEEIQIRLSHLRENKRKRSH